MPKSIFSTPGQPVIFSDNDSDNCNCGERNHCNLIVPGQQVYAQLQIQPCGTVDVCNNSTSEELVVNGEFEGETGWEEAGNNWTIGGGQACYLGADGGGILYQTITGLTVGNVYLLSYTITGFASGTLTPFLWGNNGTAISANGDYSEFITLTLSSNNFLDFVDSNLWRGCITNISLVEVFNCWDSDESDWFFSFVSVCHNPGNTTDITNLSTVLIPGDYYHFTFSISGATAGGVTLKASTAAIGAQTTGNGVFERWGIADGTDVKFTPSSDFDGCISQLEIEQYCTGYEFHFTDADGNFLSDITAYYELNEDVYNLKDFTFEQDRNEFGCYKICLIDCCQAQHALSEFITNGNFAAGGASWTSQNASFATGKARLTGGTSNWISQAIATTSVASCLMIEFDFDNIGEASVFQINVYINDVLVDTVDTLGGDGSYSQTFNNVPAGAVIKIEYTDSAPFARVLDIDNVSVSLGTDCYLYDQCSNCFKYAAEFDCTKMVEGYCEGNAFNFQFDDANGANFFKLSQRIKCELYNSSYNQEQSDYTFSTGVSSINYASSEKIKTLFIQPIPEYQHDVLALVKVCDHIFVDLIEYFSPKGEYTPEWNRSVLVDLAQSKIELKVKDQTLFNTNCQ